MFGIANKKEMEKRISALEIRLREQGMSAAKATGQRFASFENRLTTLTEYLKSDAAKIKCQNCKGKGIQLWHTGSTFVDKSCEHCGGIGKIRGRRLGKKK